jgi:hypothetical protein
MRPSTTLSPLTCKFLLSAFASFLLTTTASAHVELTSPNGGESLQGQDQFLIEWYDIVSHGPHVTYDVEYSTDQGLTWQLVATDLPYTDGISTYPWLVPDIDTTQARIRVIMILNANDHWEDISDGDFSIHASYQSYGSGTAWNGVVPTLTASGIPAAGGSIYLQANDCQAGADVHFIAGLSPLNLPRYGVTILASTELAHQVIPADANGMATLPANLPIHATGIAVYAQAVVDSSAATSASAGVQFTIL